MWVPAGLSWGLPAAAGFHPLMVLNPLIPSWKLFHSESLKFISADTNWSTSDLLIWWWCHASNPDPRGGVHLNSTWCLLMMLNDLECFFRTPLWQCMCVCVFRGPSVKRSSGMERSRSSNWDTSDENKNKLVKAASTSKLLAKVVKNAERYTHAIWK